MQTAVEHIKDRLPITEVLSSYITLIPAGRQYKAKCPFHNERTASFSISPDRGLYYCFGCGAKGDMFSFVQQFEGVDFNGALKILAERAGVELKNRDHRADDYAPVYEFLEKTTQRYQNELQKRNDALLYLKGRGLTPETISSFRLGYAPEEWRFVANSCTSDTEKYIAERAGLIKKKEEEGGGLKADGNFYDRFRGRIVFPFADSSGRVIGFSGRIYPETPEGPKYLNSPETELFQKSRVLYGFDKAKFHIKKHNFAIMVEGQMDLILSHQAGFRNTVATSGTAVSEQSAEDERANLVTLSRLTPHLFLAFDGDSAGQKALARASLVALTLGMNPKVVVLPDGVDPAEYILKEGPERWKELLKDSQHFIAHQARMVKSAGHSPHMLARALRESVFPYLSRVVSPIEQNLYVEAVAREIGIDTGEVSRELALFVASTPSGSENISLKESSKPALDAGITLAERFSAFVSRFPSDKSIEIRDSVINLKFGDHTIDNINIQQDRLAQALAIIERDYGILSDADQIAVAQELATKVSDQFFANVGAKLSAELRRAEAVGEEKKVEEILTSLMELNKRRQAS